jgi:predicted RNA-binding protein with PUA-like domain
MTQGPEQFWLVKSEEDVYPIEQLEKDGQTPWDGVRNYEARNIMRDGMKVGDRVLYYHSNANPPGVVGVARVASSPYPDSLQFDPSSPYHDPASSPENPRWILVDVAFEERFPRRVSLDEIRAHPELQETALLTRKRLSVQPVEPEAFQVLCRLGRRL